MQNSQVSLRSLVLSDVLGQPSIAVPVSVLVYHSSIFLGFRLQDLCRCFISSGGVSSNLHRYMSLYSRGMSLCIAGWFNLVSILVGACFARVSNIDVLAECKGKGTTAVKTPQRCWISNRSLHGQLYRRLTVFSLMTVQREPCGCQVPQTCTVGIFVWDSSGER